MRLQCIWNLSSLLGILALVFNGCSTQEEPIAELTVTSGETVKLGDTVELDASQSSYNDTIEWSFNQSAITDCEGKDTCSHTPDTLGTHVYKVSVKSVPPASPISTITAPLSSQAEEEVSSAAVSVTVNAKVALKVSGLSGSLTLQNNGIDDLTITTDGDYAFATGLKEGESYKVTIATQPQKQVCNLSTASGTIAGTNGKVEALCSSEVALQDYSFKKPLAVSEGVSALLTLPAYGSGYVSFTATKTGTYTISFTNTTIDVAAIISATNMSCYPYSANESCPFSLVSGTTYKLLISNFSNKDGSFIFLITTP